MISRKAYVLSMQNGAFNRFFEKVTMHDYSVESGQWVPPIDSNTRIYLYKGFKSNISTGVWNSTALFCRDSAKSVQRLGFACELASKIDIMFILEAHGQDGCQVRLVEKLRKTHHVEYFPGVSQAVGGIVICIKLRVISLCGPPDFRVIDQGRVVCVTWTSGDEWLGAVGVHIDPHYTLLKKKRIIQDIATTVRSRREALWLICGDFNFEALGEKSYNADRGSFIDSALSENLGLAWNEAFGGFIEHHQSDFTRAQNGPFGATLSRIDRIYSNLPAWRMLGTEVRTSPVGRLTDSTRLSDHLAVVSFICNSKNGNLRPLPLWATRDPYYTEALDKELSHYEFGSMAPSASIQLVKRCMRVACMQVAGKSHRRGAKTIEEQIYWSLVCVRAMFHGIAKKVVQAMVAYAELERFILVDVHLGFVMSCDMEGLSEHIAALMRQSLQRLRSDLDEVRDLPEYQVHQQRRGIQRLMDCWATRNRKTSLQAARDEQGNLIDDPEQAAGQFISHWKKVAETKIIDKKAAQTFLLENMRKIPSFRVVLDFEEFVTIVRGLPDSACGPDGIPYAAWRNASERVIYRLYLLYCSLFTGDEVADDFNFSWLVLLAKGEHDQDGELVARPAEDTRPVSLANTDSKICELALDKPLAGALSSWACEEQRGFLGGRIIVDNVVELDTYGRVVAATSARKRPGTTNILHDNHVNIPLMAFFDFAAAFPSVAWTYLWMCMKFSGLPRAYIRAFKKVYKNNVHFLRFMGKVYKAYTNDSGVKTGGTASGTIFVLCIDPFLHMLRTRCGPRDFGRGFADDIGYIIYDARTTLAAFAACFDLFGRVSNIKLKIKKTVIVPLWTLDLDEAMEVIVAIVPDWRGIRVALHAKYLGMQMGPRSANVIWRDALDNYSKRVQLARSTGAGLLCSVLEYNIMCVTALSYIAQFSTTTAEVLSVEATMLQRLTGCPRYTFTKQAMWSLQALGMPHSFKSVQVSNAAAMVRMALKTCTTFAVMKQVYDDAMSDDDNMMLNFVSKEVKLFDTPAIVNTLQTAIDTAFLPDVHHLAWRMWLRSLDSAMDKSLQKSISEFLSTRLIDFDVSTFVSRRMVRWSHLISDGAKEWWCYCGPFVIQLCKYELKGAPPCVVAAYLKTLLNGWASARRFKTTPVCCMFGCGSRQDSIEHYLCCTRVEIIWSQIMGRTWGLVESRLAVGSAEHHDRVGRAFFLYGLYAAYNGLRHGGLCGRSIQTITNMVRSHMINSLGRSSSGIRQLFNESKGYTSTRRQHTHSAEHIGEVVFTFRKRARVEQSMGIRPRGITSKIARTSNKRLLHAD